MPPFRPDGFRELAEKLRDGNAIASSEARHRTVTGRCYYASYLAVSIAIYEYHGVVRSNFEFPNHHDLGQALAKKNHDSELKQIGDALINLRARRTRADYEMDTQHLEDDADDSVADARRVSNLLTIDVVKRLPKLTGRAK